MLLLFALLLLLFLELAFAFCSFSITFTLPFVLVIVLVCSRTISHIDSKSLSVLHNLSAMCVCMCGERERDSCMWCQCMRNPVLKVLNMKAANMIMASDVGVRFAYAHMWTLCVCVCASLRLSSKMAKRFLTFLRYDACNVPRAPRIHGFYFSIVILLLLVLLLRYFSSFFQSSFFFICNRSLSFDRLLYL